MRVYVCVCVAVRLAVCVCVGGRYYSWDAGLVHYIALSTEMWFGVGNPGKADLATMLEWLEADLKVCGRESAGERQRESAICACVGLCLCLCVCGWVGGCVALCRLGSALCSATPKCMAARGGV